MNRYLKVEIYPHLFSPTLTEPKTLMVPFDQDQIHFKTSKGWLYAEVRDQAHLCTAILEEEASSSDDVLQHDSYRVSWDIVSCRFRKATRIFDDIDIYLSVVFE